MEEFLTPEKITWAVVLFAAVGLFVGGFFGKDVAKERKIDAALDRYVPIVAELAEAVAAKTENTVDDKVAFALKRLGVYLNREGVGLSSSQEVQAGDVFRALFGEDKKDV